MANEVNPPTMTPPKKWMDDEEIGPWAREMSQFWFQLWQRTGGGTDVIEEAQVTSSSGIATQSQLNAIRDQIGSGDPLTSDETGFTVDSTLLSVDMTEA